MTITDQPSNPRDHPVRRPFPAQEQGILGQDSEMRTCPDFGEQTSVGTGKLRGKIAIITGGDSGIGRAVAVALAREGADVVIAYLNENADAEQTARVVRDAGRRALVIAGDIQ